MPRLEDEVLEAFRDWMAADISDAVGPLYTMSPGIRPLYEPIEKMVGRALTVKAIPGDGLTINAALTLCQPGDVLVIDWRGHVEACGGGSHMLSAPIRAGLAGVVVDGAWRDVPDLQDLRFPIFGRGTSPVKRARTQLGEINVPVCCGGVVVNAGDLIVADAEGIVVVPRKETATVLAHVHDRSLRLQAGHAAEAKELESELDGLDALTERTEVTRSSFFGGVFAAAGGVATNWHDS